MKNLKNLGKILSKTQQRSVFGGSNFITPGSCVPYGVCLSDANCCEGETCKVMSSANIPGGRGGDKGENAICIQKVKVKPV